MSRFELSESKPLRANWLRSDAMVLFSEMCEQTFPVLPDYVDDEDIIHKLYMTIPPGAENSGIKKAMRVSELLGRAYKRSPLYREQRRAFDMTVSLQGFTFEDTATDAFIEGINTASIFPLQLMKAADFRAAIFRMPPKYTSLAPIARDLRTAWFTEQCHIAAFTTNGLWGEASFDDRASLVALNQFDTLTDFDFFTLPNGDRGFRFSENARAQLLESLRAKNHARKSLVADRRKHDLTAGSENYSYGTSSGCPVRHLQPHYSPRAASEQSTTLYALSVVLNKPSTELLADRPKTGIEHGLEMLAKLLDRAAVLECNVSNATSQPASPEASNA